MEGYMKKIMALAFALFFAVTAAAQNYASEKITQIVAKGKLEQTVFAGDDIEPVKIVYENTGFGENDVPEYSSTDFYENFGLSKTWTKGPACIISGQMRDDIVADTYSAFIVVKDNEGKLAKTELIFHVKRFSLEWFDDSGELNQNVDPGKTITPIVFDYEGITSYSVSGLPSGLTHSRDEAGQKILITGTVGADEKSGDYEYEVTVTNDLGTKITKTGTITVNGNGPPTSIKVVENGEQKVVAGAEIKPVVFQFANVPLDENLSAFNTSEGSLKGTFKYSVEGNTLTVSGTVSENLGDGVYSIKIIAVGENNRDTAFATVDVTHKSVVTKVSVTENASQTLNVGDSIKPIVFQIEHGSDPKVTNFPGGYELRKNGNTVTIVGLVEESARGQYDVVLSVTGVDNNASAKATIDVIPGTMAFDLVKGSDNQTVVAGQEIVPIVYQYNHVKLINGKKILADLKVEQDKEKKQVKIYGTVDPEMAAYEYVYWFELTDFYGNTMTVKGKVNVVASIDEISSSSNSVKSSSSSATSSSSNVILSSSEGSSSSSATSSSSSVKQSSSSKDEKKSSSSSEKSGKSSSSEKTTGIATVAMNSVKFGYANNALTVAVPTSSMVRVQVFDLTGHLVETFAEPVNGTKSINLAHLNRGNYLVRVESDSQMRTAKIAVK
jgi:hypothetical protein